MILLTGASGSVGIETLKVLLENPDNKIRIFDRRTSRSQKVLRPYADRVEFFWGDIRNKIDVRAAVRDVRAVIHLAAIIPPLADEQPELARAVNVTGTQNLIAALESEPETVRFLYASSISVYGDRLSDPWIKIGDPLNPSPGDLYGQTKVLGEKMVRSSAMNWTILRLSGVINKRFVHRKTDKIMFEVPLNTQIEWIDSADVALALAHALEDSQTVGRMLNLGGGARCRATYQELLDAVFDINGLGRGLLPREAFAAKSFHCGYFADSEKTENLLHFQRHSLDDLYSAFRAEVSRIRRLFARLFRPLIRRYLLTHSEYYQEHQASQQSAHQPKIAAAGIGSASEAKTVLITGAAGGLGLAMTRLLAGHGVHVFAAYNQRPLDLEDIHGRVTAIKMDITDADSVDQAYQAVNRLTDGLDAVINNAGIYAMSSILEGEQSDFDRIMAVNVHGAQRVTRTFFPLLLARRGRVINMSSEKARTALPFDLYGMSKQWLESYTHVLRRELNLLGLKAIIVRPGSHDTELLEPITTPTATHKMGVLTRALGRMQELASKMLPAPKDPSDVAHAVYRILMAKYPRRRYTINGSPTVALLGVLPSFTVDRLISFLLAGSRGSKFLWTKFRWAEKT